MSWLQLGVVKMMCEMHLPYSVQTDNASDSLAWYGSSLDVMFEWSWHSLLIARTLHLPEESFQVKEDGEIAIFHSQTLYLSL